jgi:hypothetical protein
MSDNKPEFLRFYSGQHQIGAVPKTHVVQRLPDHSLTSIPPEPVLMVVGDQGQCYEVQRGFINTTGQFEPVGNLKKVIKSHLMQVRLASAQHADPSICIAEIYVPSNEKMSFEDVEKMFKAFFYNHYFSRATNLHNELMNIEQSLKTLQ